MRDMTPEEIFSQLDAINLRPLDAVDLDEITNRVNAINDAVQKLEDPDADLVDPVFIFWLTGESNEL